MKYILLGGKVFVFDMNALGFRNGNSLILVFME